MKVTFLDSPALVGRRDVERVFGCTYSHYPFPNIFVLTCAAVLREGGCRAAYLDAAAGRWSRERYREFLSADDSDVYCVYGVNLSRENDLATRRAIRARRGADVPIVFLGPGPTWAPEDYLMDERCFVVRGEPEESLRELIERLSAGKGDLRGVRGLSLRHGGKVAHTASRPLIEDLDALPFPARDLLDRDLYFNPKLGVAPFTAMLTSRNCPYQCVYCVPNSLSFARELEYKRAHGRKPPVRLRGVESVVEEFRLLHKEGYRAVSIIDDQFLWGMERTKAICEGIGPLGIQWGCLARVDHVNEESVAAMAKAGCQYIDIGIESFDQRTLDFVRKGARVEDAYRAVEIIRRSGVSVKLNLLLGASPYETRSSVLRTIRLARDLAPNAVMFSIVSPFPGTEFHRMALESGWIEGGSYHAVDVQRRAILSYPRIGARELEALARRANLTFYLMPGFLWRNLRRLKSLRGAVRAIGSMRRKLSRA